MIKLAILNFKRKKKSWRMLISVMILAYAFMAMMLIFYSSLNRTEEAHREKIYGSWHVAMIDADEEAMEDVGNHATVQEYGISRTYGMALDAKKEPLGKIGTVDKNTVLMENIKLMSGNFPAKPGEIAVEKSSLSALGYMNRIGQTIQVTAQVRSEDGQKEVTQEYMLVGIVQDYSAKLKGTTPDKRDYVSFFVDEEDSISAYNGLGNIVCRLNRDFIGTNRELVKLRGSSGKGLANNYTYYELSEESGYQWKAKKKEYSIIKLICIIIFSTILSSFALGYKVNQKENMEIMHKLGGEYRELKSVMSGEFFVVNAGVAILGGGLGIIIGTLIICICKLFGVFIYLSVNITSIIISNFILFIISSTMIWCSVYLIRVKNVKRIRSKRIKRGSSEKEFFWCLNLKSAFWKLYKKDITQIFWITLLCLGVIYMGMSMLYTKVHDYRANISKDADDYRVGFLYGNYPVSLSIGTNELSQIQKIYGVKDIDAMQILNYQPITWKDEDKSEYARVLKEAFWPIYASESDSQGFVLGINSDSKSFKYYVSQLDVGKVDLKKFEKGESIIIYLPNFDIDGNGFFTNGRDGKYKENTIGLGDIIYFKNADPSVKVQVDGIIKEFDNCNCRGKIQKPFVIIGSIEFCNKLSNGNHNSYEFLVVNGDDKVNTEQTAYELSKLFSNKYFVNNNIKLEKEKREIYIGLSFWVLLSIVCIVIVAIVRKGKRDNNDKQFVNRVKILKHLGATKEYFCRECIKYEARIFILESFSALVIVLIYKIVQCIQLLEPDNTLSWMVVKTSLIICFETVPWGGILISSIVFLLLSVNNSLKQVKKVINC